MLVSATEMLQKAKAGHYAVGQFNINNLEWTKAILTTAQELNSPVILGVSEGAGKYMTGYKTVVGMVNGMMEELGITVPVALHLDHGADFEICKACIDGGFTSVMIDGSHHSFEDNIAVTKKVVEYLSKHPLVEHVNHPSLPNHPDHALYEKYFPNGGASIFTFEIKGGQEEAHKFIDNLKIFSLLANVADVKSLVIHPATTTHSQLTEEELLDQGIKPNTIRLSIGTEHIDDIIADLEGGFAAVQGK